jgi:hypothetical protein
MTFMKTEQGIPFSEAKLLVTAAISGKVVVGHSLWKDLYASISRLYRHPSRMTER